MLCCALFAACCLSIAEVPAAPDAAEFICVADDNWSFAGAETKRPFIPLGSNYVLQSKDDLNTFGPGYDGERHEAILGACAALNITLLKVFLPIHGVLPDPQEPGEARIAAGYLDNLDDFLARCRTHGIRVVVSLASWGGNGLEWWQEGGQYFGRRPWKEDGGIDSIGVLADFWRQVATRFKDNPTVFAYTPAVEWTTPGLNLTWFPPKGYSSVIDTEPGRWYWRCWLASKYEDIEALNHAWGTAFEDFEAVTLVDYTYDRKEHRYLDPEQKIFDYANFRDWTTLHYLGPQIAAIRAADPKHMVTISNHMRFWNLWEGAAKHFLGVTPFEQAGLVDYMTLHTNFHEAERREGQTDEDLVNTVRVLARFCSAAKPMPLILEEFTYTSKDPERTAQMQAALLQGTAGDVSGWTTWYLFYPGDPAVGADSPEAAHTSAWMAHDLTATPWGLAAKEIAAGLRAADLARRPGKLTVPLNRRRELVPKTDGVLVEHMRGYKKLPTPIDYDVSHEPDLDLELRCAR